jgi:hypothetical protein
MKVLVATESGQSLGCAILGSEGGEIMAMLSISLLGNLPYTVRQEAIFALYWLKTQSA